MCLSLVCLGTHLGGNGYSCKCYSKTISYDRKVTDKNLTYLWIQKKRSAKNYDSYRYALFEFSFPFFFLFFLKKFLNVFDFSFFFLSFSFFSSPE